MHLLKIAFVQEVSMCVGVSAPEVIKNQWHDVA